MPDKAIKGQNNHESIVKETQKKTSKNKILKRYFIDNGKYISFPNTIAFNFFPAGIYFPDTDKNGIFVLKRIDPMNKRAAEEMVREQLDDELTSCIADMFAEEDTGDFSSRDIHRLLKRIEDASYLNENFFPMHLWNEGLQRIDSSIKSFLENRELYEKNKLDYRRSFLLYGEHGSGKSRYIDYISKKMIDDYDAIIIRLDSHREISLTIERGLIPLEANLGDRQRVFIIEEFAQIAGRASFNELLNFMDNAIIRSNIMFILSTNSVHQIAKPFLDRPGRIDVLERVGTNYKSGFTESFYKFITGKELPESSKGESWYRANLPAAYLKELFLISMLNDESPEVAWRQVEKRKHLINSDFDERDRLDMIM